MYSPNFYAHQEAGPIYCARCYKIGEIGNNNGSWGELSEVDIELHDVYYCQGSICYKLTSGNHESFTTLVPVSGHTRHQLHACLSLGASEGIGQAYNNDSHKNAIYLHVARYHTASVKVTTRRCTQTTVLLGCDNGGDCTDYKKFAWFGCSCPIGPDSTSVNYTPPTICLNKGFNTATNCCFTASTLCATAAGWSLRTDGCIYAGSIIRGQHCLCSNAGMAVGGWSATSIASTDYLQLGSNSWINVGTIGLYSGTNDAHILPNSTTDYGAWRILGARNGWNGINMCDLTIMSNGSGGGLYNDTENEWVLLYARNSYTYLYYNGASKVETTNTGMHVNGAITASGDITAYSSDRRLKCNIHTITCAADRIKALRGVEFEWDRKYICDNNLNFVPSEEEKTVGFIAQELENTLPTAVREAPFETKLCREVSWAEKYKTVKAEKIIPLLVEAAKEQQCTIEKQQRQINTLTCQVEMLLKRCA
jgi:hypothetical protein